MIYFRWESIALESFSIHVPIGKSMYSKSRALIAFEAPMTFASPHPVYASFVYSALNAVC